MKENVKIEIIKSNKKIMRLEKQTREIQEKLEKLQEALMQIEESISKEQLRIKDLGLKHASKDPARPDTSEQLELKRDFNQNLQEEKKLFYKEELHQEVPEFLEKSTAYDFLRNITY